MSRIGVRAAVLFALLSVAGSSFAQYADKAPTAGVDTPASPEGALERQNQHDSVLAGGRAANLPDVEISFPTSTPTTPPSTPPGGISTSYGQQYACAIDGGGHDANSTAILDFMSDGSWKSSKGTTPGPGSASGIWHASPVAGGDWEIRITGNIITDESCPANHWDMPVDTGWMPLDAMRRISVTAFASSTTTCPIASSTETWNFTATIRNRADTSQTDAASGKICARATAN